jgi:hypothetical protein
MVIQLPFGVPVNSETGRYRHGRIRLVQVSLAGYVG